MRARAILLSTVKKFWWWLREATGDAAYENYLRRVSRESHVPAKCQIHGETHGSEGVLTAEQFYLERLQRKFARVSRCC